MWEIAEVDNCNLGQLGKTHWNILHLKNFKQLIKSSGTCEYEVKLIICKLCSTDACIIDSRGVATAQGKQGIWMLTFADRDNTGKLVKRDNTGKLVNLIFTQGKFWQHRGVGDDKIVFF